MDRIAWLCQHFRERMSQDEWVEKLNPNPSFCMSQLNYVLIHVRFGCFFIILDS